MKYEGDEKRGDESDEKRGDESDERRNDRENKGGERRESDRIYDQYTQTRAPVNC